MTTAGMSEASGVVQSLLYCTVVIADSEIVFETVESEHNALSMIKLLRLECCLVSGIVAFCTLACQKQKPGVFNWVSIPHFGSCISTEGNRSTISFDVCSR